MPWTEEREAGKLGGVFSLSHNLVLCPRHHHGPHWAAVCPALLSGPIPAPPTGITIHPQLGYYPQEVNDPQAGPSYGPDNEGMLGEMGQSGLCWAGDKTRI